MEKQITCREVVELVTDYLEGSLSAEIRVQLDRHLAECDGCSAYLDQMRQTIRLTGQFREESLSSEQRDELLRLFQDWKKS
jgi:predicted anti-sigma-YlaC factor YlaD